MAKKLQLRDIPDGPVAKALWAPSAGSPGSIPGQGTRSHMQRLGHGAAKYIDKIIIKRKSNSEAWPPQQSFSGASLVETIFCKHLLNMEYLHMGRKDTGCCTSTFSNKTCGLSWIKHILYPAGLGVNSSDRNVTQPPHQVWLNFRRGFQIRFSNLL